MAGSNKTQLDFINEVALDASLDLARATGDYQALAVYAENRRTRCWHLSEMAMLEFCDVMAMDFATYAGIWELVSEWAQVMMAEASA